MSKTYDVTLANTNDGAVHGHKTGCADLKRGKAYTHHRAEQFTVSVADRAEARAEYNADFDQDTDGWYEIEWLPCAKHVPEGAVEAPLAAEEPGPAESTAEPEFAALATKDWRGNYNTVFAPAAELIGASAGVEVRTVAVSVMLKQTEIAGDEAEQFGIMLAEFEQQALAAMKTWQKTLDRKDVTDMEKYNQNRSFLSGYLGAVAQALTPGAKKPPVVTFAKDMERALRAEALKAGVAARKAAGKMDA